jgi:RNA polymerase II C-terminal domain phosphatase-like 3/4
VRERVRNHCHNLGLKKLTRFTMKIISEMGFPQDSPELASSSLGSMGVPGDTCAHPTVVKGKCLVCDERLDKRYGLAFRYIDKDLWLSHDEIAQQRMVQSEKLLKDRKIVLVLDLDYTLLHTTSVKKYLKTQEELNSQPTSNPGLFPLAGWRRMTKLRPYVHTFLKEASTMFEMYIYTTGERRYALMMANFLDPEKVYFESRIIAYEDFRNEEKSLGLVLKDERMVLVLDDTKKVWRKHPLNWIRVKKYIYFDLERDKTTVSLSALNTDEGEITGQLATILKKLQLIHRLFFNPKSEGGLAYRDVRLIIPRLRVLQRCNLFFKNIFPPDFEPENSRLWMMAEELGAICSKDLCASITHVVAYLVPKTEESQQAEQENKFRVHPRWLHACYDTVERKAEEGFSVDDVEK